MQRLILGSRWLLLCAVTGLLFLAPGAKGDDGPPPSPCEFTDGFYKKFGLDLGDAGRTHRFAIFTYGAGTSSTSRFTALDVSATSSTTLFGYQIMGDIGLAGAYSNLTVSGYGSVSGDRYVRTTSTETKVGPNATIAGTLYSSSSIDSAAINAIAALKNVSNTAAGFAGSSGSPTNINMVGGSTTISNNPFGGKYVMNLSNLVMSNGATLTLNGVSGSAFVINVAGNFNLNSSARIMLTGGLTTSDVLFNVRGSSGTFSITGNSLFTGTLLAYNSASSVQRTLTVSDSNTLVRGQIIANKVVVNGGGKVRKPPKLSCDSAGDGDEKEREKERD